MNLTQFILFTFFVICTIVCCTYGQSTDAPAVAADDGKEKEEECSNLNGSCEECLKSAHCLWCSAREDKCSDYPKGKILPSHDDCPLDLARWGTCWVNYKILLISMGIVAGAITLGITCCCLYCCCCRGNDRLKRKLEEDEKKYERQSEERKSKHSEKRKERESKYDEIRKKYGLKRDDNPYERFEEDA